MIWIIYAECQPESFIKFLPALHLMKSRIKVVFICFLDQFKLWIHSKTWSAVNWATLLDKRRKFGFKIVSLVVEYAS